MRNTRFEKIADENKEKTSSRQENLGPPPVINSRFSAVVEEDRSYQRNDKNLGPPLVVNSRFAAATEADRSYDRQSRNFEGPPPVANSRFAAAAEADRSYQRDDRGPPPVANSRFSAAAEADRSYQRDDRDRGPPPVANSRFAAAAEADRSYQRDDRDNHFNRGDDRGPPIPQNSRFAAAVAMDEDYVDRDERERRMQVDRDRKFDDRGGSGRRGMDNYHGGTDYRGGMDGPTSNDYEEPSKPSRIDELLKPKKQANDENVLVPPTKEHEANMLKIPAKLLVKEEEILLPTKKNPVEGSVKKITATHEEAPTPIAAVSSEKVEKFIDEFISGSRLGEDLKNWVEEHFPTFLNVERLVFRLLSEREKQNPDPECSWGEASQFGTALLFLVVDNLNTQIQVLWAIQKYCDSLRFPKLNGESVVQSMFRAMYKHDLVLDDAFADWKEDESDFNEQGKMTAIIQTVDWFNWLEEDDAEGDEEEVEE